MALKGIPKQKIKCVLKIGPWLSTLSCERTKFQLLFLQKLSSIYWFCWEPPAHFFPSQFTIFLRCINFFALHRQFFCVPSHATQKNCQKGRKKIHATQKNCRWDGKKWTGGSKQNQLIEDNFWRKRSWNLVLSQVNVESQGPIFKTHLIFCFGIPLTLVEEAFGFHGRGRGCTCFYNLFKLPNMHFWVTFWVLGALWGS